MHVKDGKIKAYLDSELPQDEMEQVGTHLHTCVRCQTVAQELSVQSERTLHRLDLLSPLPSESALTSRQARARLDNYINRKAKENMFTQLFSKKFRPLWIGAALIVLLAAALSIPSVRALANDFLGLFRVEQFTIVQVNPADLPAQLGDSVQFEEMLSKNVTVEEKGQPQDAQSPEQASQLAGFPVRLPSEFKEDAQLVITPATDITFQVDLKLIQGILDEIGLQDVDLPTSLDGAEVSVEVPNGVSAASGECALDPEMVLEGFDPDDPDSAPLPDCTSFVQMPSPNVNTPPGLDISRIGEAYLQLLGMTPEEAAQFSSHVDWTTTLVIPVPLNGTQYQEVPVDGVTGTLILSEGRTTHYMLMWVKDGMIYALTGPGNSSRALRTAGSIE